VWRSLRWDRAPELIETLGRQAMTLLDWSLVFGAVTLAVTTLLAFALIVAPLGRMPAVAAPFTRTGIAAYFALLGIGYMFVEIAVLQRATLFFGEPVVAASIVIATFLAGSGVGSAMAPAAATRRSASMLFAALGLGMMFLFGLFWLATPMLVAPPMTLRIGSVVAALLPLAWAMGRPFPWGLARLADQPRWIPWAWGVNGLACVAAASLAPLVSVHLGQRATLGAGMSCYALALAVALRYIRAGITSHRNTGLA
jgi:predicted membrane-bound spermidine synthase